MVNRSTRYRQHLSLLLASIVLLGSGCAQLKVNTLRERMAPSNHRDWSPELAVLPMAEIDRSSGLIQLKNIRNCQYLSADDFVVQHYDREINIDQIQSVDFVVVPFKQTPALAHTMLSFGIDDGSYLSVSIEIRKEKGESFSPVSGANRRFELMYVVADERDVIRLRTRHRKADVYVYPTIATPEKAKRLFVDVMQRVNQLAQQPEFYNTLTNNCTTNLAAHVNTVAEDRIKYNWKVLLPGFSARYAYDLGLLPQDVPFDDLTTVAYVNEIAETHYDEADFSQRIRGRRPLLERIAQRDQLRATRVPHAPSGRTTRPDRRETQIITRGNLQNAVGLPQTNLPQNRDRQSEPSERPTAFPTASRWRAR